jgi:F-type H+-transporting ATPase subunit a
LFLFILFNAWIALAPVYGSVTVAGPGGEGGPLLKGAGTDINMPLALAAASGVFVELVTVASLRGRYLKRFSPVGLLLSRRYAAGLLGLFIVVVETATQLFRLLSFAFRLFGSMTAGEVLVVLAGFAAPLVVTVPLYGLEALIGLLQAVIFAGLTAVFANLSYTEQAAPEVGAHD